MQDLLSANMMSIVEKRCEDATGAMKVKSQELLHMLGIMMTSAYPIQTDQCFNSRHSGVPQTARDIEWVPIFHLEPFETAWRATLGLPEHTFLELLMENEILRRIRSRNFDVSLYAAKLLTAGEWDKLEQGYQYGQCNIAKAVINSAIRIGATPELRKPRPIILSDAAYDRLTEILEEPASANPKLVDLMRRRNKWKVSTTLPGGKVVATHLELSDVGGLPADITLSVVHDGKDTFHAVESTAVYMTGREVEIICDGSNNSQDDIDNNRLIVDVVTK